MPCILSPTNKPPYTTTKAPSATKDVHSVSKDPPALHALLQTVTDQIAPSTCSIVAETLSSLRMKVGRQVNVCDRKPSAKALWGHGYNGWRK
eukprot:1159067-Pelagomonas_calceolata.AAC.6